MLTIEKILYKRNATNINLNFDTNEVFQHKNFFDDDCVDCGFCDCGKDPIFYKEIIS